MSGVQEKQNSAMERSIKILIVEDEMLIAAKISTLLTELGYEVVGILAHAEDALLQAEENVPDIALLDIRLKGKMDGVELALALQKERELPIIFLTANADEATFNRAKVAKPYAFIPKPFKKVDLQRAIELTISRMAQRHAPASEDEHAENTSFILGDRIFVRQKGKMTKILLQDILYLEAERSYCKIHTLQAEYLMSISLGLLEEKLSANNFLRIHRSFIVNLHKIDTISDDWGYIGIGTKTLSVSRTFKDELRRRLQII